jgi:uncharacterized membrane protein HdeD (DUF308 family)
MKKRTKNVVSVIGVILLVLGITTSIPLFLQKSYLGMITGLASVIVGLILLAIAFGD